MKKITRIEPTAAQPVMTKTKVAAYCRVSTEADAQLVSLETQKSHYEELIKPGLGVRRALLRRGHQRDQ